MKPPLIGDEGPITGRQTTRWKFHLDYISDGDELQIPPCGVIEETHHDTGQLAVWWREPIRDIGGNDDG